jgi:hypothetical protein
VSFDLGVWYEPSAITNEQATKKYLALCEGNVDEVTEHPSVDGFLDELRARYPDLDELPDEEVDDSPWSCGCL